MKRTQIQIHSKQLQWLKQEALTKGVSMAQLIRESIDLYHAHIERSRKLGRKRENALEAVGRFSSID